MQNYSFINVQSKDLILFYQVLFMYYANHYFRILFQLCCSFIVAYLRVSPSCDSANFEQIQVITFTYTYSSQTCLLSSHVNLCCISSTVLLLTALSFITHCHHKLYQAAGLLKIYFWLDFVAPLIYISCTRPVLYCRSYYLFFLILITVQFKH